ncbi:RluA family pseudouridine synthase [Brackiella oedipodis]|uniref:RluA family pseudouridine synthase n=1 Tax=Brackiella oedipodis TaxID=124225 RepID=UPI0006887699|nr:RluA family pseudouridine synthase [Brackiella oedipodis]
MTQPSQIDTTEQASSKELVFELPLEQETQRLDKYLSAQLPEHSRSRIQDWITQGFVTVNGRAVKPKHQVVGLDRIHVIPQAAPEDSAFEPEDVDFEVIAEHRDWLVINKPVGLVTHPGAGNWSGTLLNGLLFRYPELARVARAGIVHRLDKDTSGLLVVARTETAQTALVRQLQARTVGRLYTALVKGHTKAAGQVDKAIGRDPKVPVRMSSEAAIAPKPALTEYQVLRRGDWQDHAISMVQCKLHTGRTHQIRVHLSSIQHPLLGDTLYQGPEWAGAERQMLHARVLQFKDPQSQTLQHFEAPLAPDMCAVIENIHWLPNEENP